jgi:hypothetical protein
MGHGSYNEGSRWQCMSTQRWPFETRELSPTPPNFKFEKYDYLCFSFLCYVSSCIASTFINTSTSIIHSHFYYNFRKVFKIGLLFRNWEIHLSLKIVRSANRHLETLSKIFKKSLWKNPVVPMVNGLTCLTDIEMDGLRINVLDLGTSFLIFQNLTGMSRWTHAFCGVWWVCIPAPQPHDRFIPHSHPI